MLRKLLTNSDNVYDTRIDPSGLGNALLPELIRNRGSNSTAYQAAMNHQ